MGVGVANSEKLLLNKIKHLNIIQDKLQIQIDYNIRVKLNES
jgi:hypothetical protein